MKQMELKTIIKDIFLIILITALILMFASCGETETGSGTAAKTVVDCMKREVKIPESPEKVAVLYASAAHMMAMLDEGAKIAAVPNGVKSDELMLMKYPNISEVSVPYQESTINVEELAALDVDLAVVRVSTAENKGETDKLDKLGIPYVAVDYTDIGELKTAVGVMGDIFDKEEKAESYINFMEETINLVTNNIKNVEKSEYPVVYHSVNEAIRTDAEDDICMEVMELAGTVNAAHGKNVQAEGNKNYTTLEEIYNWEPYAVIANEYSVSDYILSDPKWSGISAVSEKRVYTLPVGATRWCHPGSMEPHMGVLAIANMFHGDDMQDVDMNKYLKEYYKEYFGLELDDDTVTKLLSGRGMRVSNAPEQN